MASVAIEKNQPAVSDGGETCSPLVKVRGGGGEGLRQYYMQHIHELQIQVRQKSHNLNRLEAQRNDLNSKVRMLREELQLLQEPGSYVGEVVKVMGKSKVLVKVHPEGKYVVDIDKNIDITKITPSTRVALRNDSYVLHLILPSKVDPLVNLMKVEKVPDSTYDMIGGLDQQIKEIKEVIELPIKHPELFESLGIAQPKGVLLYGPPGTGKTLLARAVAHHTDCTFIRVSGSELVQKYIGEGSRMVRELFVMAREHAPSIIFMDEIDSIGSARMESGTGNGDSEVQRTMLELLNQGKSLMAGEKVKVFGYWASPFALRVEWALKLKGVEYEYIHEDLSNKSPELLHYNPVTKKIPVLVHGEKAIAESFVIVEYIDETWSDGHPILPTDPYERAQARFWAKFSEDKCLPAFYGVFLKTGEDQQEAVKDAQATLRTLEQALEGKKFFGGETIGYVDIIVGWYPFWIRMIEDLAGVSIVNDESLPLLNAWFDSVMDVELVNERLPPKEKTYAFNRARREQIISGQLNQ